MGLDAPAAEVTITPDEVRRMTLRAQGFLGATSRRGGVAARLRRVGAVQLDTISVLARSHELVAYARLGAVSRSQIEQARSEEHTSELQSLTNLVCRLL